MASYFRTLDRVISLQPKVIIPSHGVPMTGTYRLEATIKHRRERESQVLELFRTGKKETEILKILYHDVDVRLHPQNFVVVLVLQLQQVVVHADGHRLDHKHHCHCRVGRRGSARGRHHDMSMGYDSASD